LTEEEVERCIEERQRARQAKNYVEADRIRDELAQKGIQLEDAHQGTRWRVVIGPKL
jgi:cysteinyl-tRNA synthetase